MESPYDRPDLYDLIAPRDPAMEAFYVETALAGGRHVLDLACGTGRITIPLAAAGLEAVGGDLSEPMLDAARRNAAARGVAPEFISLDMRGFTLPGRLFETVVIAANSLLHLNSATDFAGFFATVRRHLAPGGLLAFDIFVPSIAMLARDPHERHPVGTFPHPTLGEVTLEETTSYDPISQVSHVQWLWSSAAESDFWCVPLTLRQVFPEELSALLRANGFELMRRFGDFDRSAFGHGSWRQVCVAVPA